MILILKQGPNQVRIQSNFIEYYDSLGIEQTVINTTKNQFIVDHRVEEIDGVLSSEIGLRTLL